MAVALRPYQVEGIQRIRAAMLAGHRRILAVAPTGAGKTVLSAEMIRLAVSRGHFVAFLAHRQELINQTSAKLDHIGIPHGIIQGNHPRWAPHLPVQVASVPTVARRQMRFPRGLIFIDECHRASARSYREILARSPESYVIGLTATPVRTDGKGLDDVFETLIEIATPAELIEQGYLLRPRLFAPENPDLTGVAIKRNDFDPHELAVRMDKPKLIGNVIEHWSKLARGRRTVLFATSIAHSEHLVAAFEGAGARAAHLDATTPADRRADILRRLADGELDVISNVGILTEGWDLPRLGAAILARPTASEALYLQMVGRVMRPDPEKPDAVVIDHAGNIYRHGFPWDLREWSLAGKASKEKSEARVKQCLACYALVASTASICPECGAGFETASREEPGETEGDLVEVNDLPPIRRRPVVSQAVSLASIQQRQAYLAWQAEAAAKGYAPGYAAVQFKRRFGFWPSRRITDSALELVARGEA